jgi:DNA-binding LytR/AlgR family response regulator
VKVIEAGDVHCFFSIDHVTHIGLKEIDYAYQTSLKTLGDQLDPKLFGRIHRNCIVKWSEVAAVNRGNNMSVRLKNGKEFQVSRESRQVVKERLGF